MNVKTILLTGACTPLGQATALRLLNQGHRCILTAKDPEALEPWTTPFSDQLMVRALDFTDRASILSFTDQIHRETAQLDVFIHLDEEVDFNPWPSDLAERASEQSWFTFHLAPLLLINRLMDRLISSWQGRIILSGYQGLPLHPLLSMKPFEAANSEAVPTPIQSYQQAKLAQFMCTRWLSSQLTGTMVTANAFQMRRAPVPQPSYQKNVPWLKNAFELQNKWALKPEKLAETLEDLALNPSLEDISGLYIGHPLKTTALPSYAKDPLTIERVMQLSFQQLGIEPAITYEMCEPSV